MDVYLPGGFVRHLVGRGEKKIEVGRRDGHGGGDDRLLRIASDHDLLRQGCDEHSVRILIDHTDLMIKFCLVHDRITVGSNWDSGLVLVPPFPPSLPQPSRSSRCLQSFRTSPPTCLPCPRLRPSTSTSATRSGTLSRQAGAALPSQFALSLFNLAPPSLDVWPSLAKNLLTPSFRSTPQGTIRPGCA